MLLQSKSHIFLWCVIAGLHTHFSQLCVCVCMCVCTCVSACVCVCLCMCLCGCVCMCECTHMCDHVKYVYCSGYSIIIIQSNNTALYLCFCFQNLMPRTIESIAIIITTAASTTPTINPGETLLLLLPPLLLPLVDSSSTANNKTHCINYRLHKIVQPSS